MSNKFVSLLKSIGTIAVKVVNTVIGAEQKLEPGLETAIPASIPYFALADAIIHWIQSAEASFAVVGQSANGPAKLNAVVSAVSNEFDAWIQSKLPGDSKLQDAANYLAGKQTVINGFVQVLNSFSATQQVGAAVATGETIIAAAAAKASTTPTVAQP